MKHSESFFPKDIIAVFDFTLNEDSKNELIRLLNNPLPNVEQILERQNILKSIIKSGWIDTYHYHKIDYAEANHFLTNFRTDKLKPIDYLTYQFQKKENNILKGHYFQLAYFLTKIETFLNQNDALKLFPKGYQEELNSLLDFIALFPFKQHAKQLKRGKLSYKLIQKLNLTVIKHRKDGAISHFFKTLNRFEAYLSVANSIQKYQYCFPTFDNNGLQLVDLYHPALKNPVKYPIDFNNGVILLTGANMSGKSTLLKSISLAVYLGHLGIGVPASQAQLSFFDYISVYINHSDDLKNGYSHFMREIQNVKDLVSKLKEGQTCFAVFDEMYNGTNHDDALEISLQTIMGLRKYQNSTFLISTHLTELKNQLTNAEIPSFYLDATVEDGKPKFTYILKPGWNDLKIGRILFNLIGLKKML